ncbi:hypothetical protein GGS20DRAFT_552395 [Poronia punctata]|nr:hypothetical protein GGS20DRAFT_552395 [Poronia punctata]
MVYIPPRAPQPRRQSQLPEEIEDVLRDHVLEAVGESDGITPTLIIGNVDSGCHGMYYYGPRGRKFVFHHCKMQNATSCKCIADTAELPEYLEKYRARLIRGRAVTFRLAPRLAAMVVMKSFLGMSIPEPLLLADTVMGEMSSVGSEFVC